MWYLNLRKLLTEKQWIELSNKIRQEQDFTCQACYISIKQLKNKKYFHCHEMWEFNDVTNEVNLLCLMTLCSHCHLATHMGFASVQNKDNFALKHMCKVNKWDIETARHYIEGSFEEWSRRSAKTWKINIDSFNDWLDQEMIETIRKKLENN